MLERPGLAEEKIVACLRDDYAVAATGVTFLPLGNDSGAWTYQVSAEGGNIYFLKVKAGRIDAPGVLIPRHLKDQGLEQVVAPLPARSQALWQPVDGFGLSLYPFVEGRSGMQAGLSDEQWTAYGAFLKNLHSTRLPADLGRHVPAETFVPRWATVVRSLSTRVHAGRYADGCERQLAAIWKERSGAIAQSVSRAEALGRVLQSKPPGFVLCHADIHTANILIDKEGRLFVVDWDGLLFAPRERDLMFVIGARQAPLFFVGYANTQIDRVAVAYYRYEWVVQEIGDYGERVFLNKNTARETRDHAVQAFRQLFQPGDVVEAAYESQTALPPHLKSGAGGRDDDAGR